MLEGNCLHIKSPLPCGTEFHTGHATIITFPNDHDPKPWTLVTGEVVEPRTFADGKTTSEYRIQHCRADLIDPRHFQYLQLYAIYKDGFLPYEGGIARQDAKYVQAMRVISAEVNRIERKKLDEQKEKTRR